jgi:hypothetical protein
MYQPREYRTALILAAALAGAGLMSGCAARTEVADSAAPHHWDEREATAYQRYVIDQHAKYVPYASANEQEQHDYWNWRAKHPG